MGLLLPGVELFPSIKIANCTNFCVFTQYKNIKYEDEDREQCRDDICANGVWRFL
jgi:hypothetical protein